MRFKTNQNMLFFSRDDFFYDETNTKFSKEGCLEPEVATFGIFNTVMTTADNVTDYIQAAEYWNSDNFWWAGLTLGVRFIPMITSCMAEIMNTIRYYHDRPDLVSWRQSFKKTMSHFPVVQLFVHVWHFIQLKTNMDIMIKARRFYESFKPENVTDENRSHYQIQMLKAASSFVQARKTFKKLMTEFQELKLYEAFGEAAPQAVLQIGIILQLGYITPMQILTVTTSLFSFSQASTDIFLIMKTKRKDIREASWKEKYLFVFPAMVTIVYPRIVSLSLIAIYARQYFFVFTTFMVVANILVNHKEFTRNPGEVFLGAMTNIFSPCIVNEEGSGFYKRSGKTSSILHIIAQITLFCLVFFQTIIPCPNSESHMFSPMMHCFKGNISRSSNHLATCEVKDLSVFKNCSLNGFDQNLGLDLTDAVCIQDYGTLLPIHNMKTDKNGTLIHPYFKTKPENVLTICENIPFWLPLLIWCIVLILFHIIAIILISLLLNKIIDPVVMLQYSKCCFPANLFKPVWNEDEVGFLNQKRVEDFLNYPCHSLLKPGNLLNVSIQNDLHEVIHIALNEMENPIKVDKPLLDQAYFKGSVKTIKMLLKKIEERDASNFDLKGLRKMLESLRKQKREFNRSSQPIKEPVFALQRYCGLSSVQQRYHWDTLQLPQTSLLRIEITCAVVGHGMKNGNLFSLSFKQTYILRIKIQNTSFLF